MRRFLLAAIVVLIAGGLLAAGLDRHTQARQLLGPTTAGGGAGGIALTQFAKDATQQGSGINLLSYTSTTPMPSNVTSGHFEVVTASACLNSGCTSTGATFGLSGITHTQGTACVALTGAAREDGNHIFRVEMWGCPVTSTGADTFTFTIQSPGFNFPIFYFSEWSGLATSPDDGVGNGADFTSNSVSVATNGAITQTNELVLTNVGATTTATITNSQGTAIDGCGTSAGACRWYQIPTATGVITSSATITTAPLWVVVTVGLKHP